jgi:effector-binding domain-containing protein
MTWTRTTIEPKLIDRAEQPYVAIRRQVTMGTLAEVADELPSLFEWLAGKGIDPAGPPFFKYNAIRMPDLLDVEVGVPVRQVPEPEEAHSSEEAHSNDRIPADDRMLIGVLPGGRFASVTHVGHPNGLLEATGALLDWGSEQGLRWDMSETDQGENWGLRLELYKTDPAIEPDLNKWETDLVFRLAD